jgi:hypothetical protein
MKGSYRLLWLMSVEGLEEEAIVVINSKDEAFKDVGVIRVEEDIKEGMIVEEEEVAVVVVVVAGVVIESSKHMSGMIKTGSILLMMKKIKKMTVRSVESMIVIPLMMIEITTHVILGTEIVMINTDLMIGPSVVIER